MAPERLLLQRSRLADSVFVYGGGKLALASAARVARKADGIVLRGKSGGKLAKALKRSAPEIDVILDPSLYERPPSTQLSLIGLNSTEVLRQAELGLSAFLSPSHFVPDGNDQSLERVLTDGRDFCGEARARNPQLPAFIVLPISRFWLTVGLNSLIGAISSVEERIALVLGDQNDPLDSADAVRGLISIVGAHPMVSLMRSDLGTIGAMVCGAEMGAIGTGTSVRHFVQPGKRGGGVPRDKTPSTLVPSLWDYVKGSKLGQVPDNNPLLRCFCSVCDGRSLSRFADDRLIEESHEHSVETWYDLTQWVLGIDVEGRRSAWRSACRSAIDAHEDLSAQSGVLFEASGQLRAWADAL